MLAAWEASRLLDRLSDPMVVKIPFASWLPLPPSEVVPLFIGAWLLAALLFAAGWYSRKSGAVLAILTAYLVVLDQQTYSNHLYLLFVAVVLLTIADSGAAWSIDARREGEPREVPLWPIVLMKVQVTVVYGFSGLAKLTRPYLQGEVLAGSVKQKLWSALPDAWTTPGAMSVLAITSIVIELFIAAGLWSRGVRTAAIMTAAVFHLLIIVVIDSSRLSLLIFGLVMLALVAAFIDVPRSGRWPSRLRGQFGSA